MSKPIKIDYIIGATLDGLIVCTHTIKNDCDKENTRTGVKNKKRYGKRYNSKRYLPCAECNKLTNKIKDK